jgi:glutamine synthetase
MVQVDFRNIDHTPFELCPRTLLKRACADLKARFGYEMKVGIEVEFFLFKKEDGKFKPFETNTYLNINSLAKVHQDFNEISRQLKSLGVTVEHIHKECGHG